MDGTMKQNNRKKEQYDGVQRNSLLIKGRTSKMAWTYIGSALCVAAVTAVDSLVAGISIGSDALAAIAAAAPFLAIGQILHCLLGFGIDKLMIQAIGRGKRKESNRIFGAVLIAVLAVYLIVFILLLIFERPLLELFMKDQTLIEGMIRYTQPLFLTAPVFEVFLCIERAFRVDGRSKLFAQRSIITNIGNILFDILLVSELGMDISGLAWASVISTALGYIVTLSHFFSKKRTVSPDLTVIRSPKEMWSYIKDDIRLGGSATLDEVMDGLALAAQTATVGAIGGSQGLAIWAVFKALRGILLSVSNGASASVSIHAGLLNGQKDYDGVRYSLKNGIAIAFGASLLAFLLVHAFAEGISALYRIEPELRELCASCLRIGSFVFPAFAFLSVMSAYLPSVNRIGLTNVLVLVQKCLVILSAMVGYYMVMQNFYTVYVIAVWLTALMMIVLLAHDRFWFVPERNPEMIADYSIRLKPDQIRALSVDADETLENCNYPDPFCAKVALILEDSMNYIARQNPDTEISADIQLKRFGDGVQLLIIDDGEAYNPIASLEEADWDTPGMLEARIVSGFTAVVNYDRVLDLNHLSLTAELPAADEAAEQTRGAEDE